MQKVHDSLQSDEESHETAGIAPPIYQTATFRFPVSELEQDGSISERLGDRYYTRYGNPTQTLVEAEVASLEGAEAALVFGSGMAAITTAILSTVKQGDHIVALRDLYGGTFALLSRWLPRFGVETTFADGTEVEDLREAIRPNTRLFYLESPTNPTMKLVDLKGVARLAKQNHLLTMMDNTLATPVNQRPIEFGIDVVVHSATKYLAGHSDLVCGVVAGSRHFIRDARENRNELGGIIDPHAAWLLLRGLKTLRIRVEHQNLNAMKLAQFLEQHARVGRVCYPLLESHPQYGLARQQMKGGGGLLSFDLAGTADDLLVFLRGLKRFSLAPSLGGVESLVGIPARTSHDMLSPADRKRAGISDGMVRLSVGIEDSEELIADIGQALEKVATAGTREVPNHAAISQGG